MKTATKFSFFSAPSPVAAATVTYTLYHDQSSPEETKEIPIQYPSSNDPPPTAIPITVNLSQHNAAATKIQSAYRAHVIRTLYKTISAVNSQADELQRQIQRQETVDAIRRDERERLRMNEALMGLLLRLDSVPGVDPTVREARRKVSRRIVGLQEVLDAICQSMAAVDGVGWWDPHGFLRDWDEAMWGMEEELCRERGGEEMERFCAQYLGFRCLQRFLREP